MQWNNHQDMDSRQKARTESKVVLHIYIRIYASYICIKIIYFLKTHFNSYVLLSAGMR